MAKLGPDCVPMICGTETECRACWLSWDTGDDFECPYLDKESTFDPTGQERLPLWPAMAVVIGLVAMACAAAGLIYFALTQI